MTDAASSAMYGASDLRTDMHEVPLEPQPSQLPAAASRFSSMLPLVNMRSMSISMPKFLPMIYTLFCLKLHERTRKGSEAQSVYEDVEVAASPSQARSCRQVDNPSIFLVPRLPDSTLFVSRPSVQRASSRFFSWVKHSIFRVPRRTPIVG